MSLEIITSEEFHWRNSMRPLRFFAFDAKVCIFLIALLFYPRYITLGAFVAAMVLFSALEQRGLLFDPALRAFRTWLYGARRPGWMWFRKKRKMIDYGGY